MYTVIYTVIVSAHRICRCRTPRTGSAVPSRLALRPLPRRCPPGPSRQIGRSAWKNLKFFYFFYLVFYLPQFFVLQHLIGTVDAHKGRMGIRIVLCI